MEQKELEALDEGKEKGDWLRTKRLSEDQIRAMLTRTLRELIDHELTDSEWKRYWTYAKLCSLSEDSQRWLTDRFMEALRGLEPGMPQDLYGHWGFKVPRPRVEGMQRGPRRYKCKYPLCRKGGIRRKRPKLFLRSETDTDPYCDRDCLNKQKRRSGWYYKRAKAGYLIKIEKRTCSLNGCSKEFYPPSRKVRRCQNHRSAV